MVSCSPLVNLVGGDGCNYYALNSALTSTYGILLPRYHLSPYTYLVEGLLGQAIGRQEIACSAVEFVFLNPPSGQTCGQYMEPFISFAGGYLTNADASSACQFCSVRSSDKFLAASFNIFYDNRWRDFGILMAFVLFNVSNIYPGGFKAYICELQIFCIYLLTYLFRIRTGSLLPSFKRSAQKT